MMTISAAVPTFIVALHLAFMVGTVDAEAGSFTFTKIDDTRGQFRRFDFPGAPSVNKAGTVAFLAELDTGVGGIFASDGQSATTIADGSGIFLGIGGFGQYPAINASGTIAFLSHLDSEARVFSLVEAVRSRRSLTRVGRSLMGLAIRLSTTSAP